MVKNKIKRFKITTNADGVYKYNARQNINITCIVYVLWYIK